jgi:hypothetical protein
LRFCHLPPTPIWRLPSSSGRLPSFSTWLTRMWLFIRVGCTRRFRRLHSNPFRQIITLLCFRGLAALCLLTAGRGISFFRSPRCRKAKILIPKLHSLRMNVLVLQFSIQHKKYISLMCMVNYRASPSS